MQRFRRCRKRMDNRQNVIYDRNIIDNLIDNLINKKSSLRVGFFYFIFKRECKIFILCILKRECLRKYFLLYKISLCLFK